jgi:hypothetical protein
MAIKLKEMTPILIRNYMARTNTFFSGKPALGKTETIEAFVAKMQQRIENFRAWYFYAPTMSPMDIQASAPDPETGLLRLYNNEALPNAYREPDATGIMFLGELPNADPTTAKLLQKYVNGEDMSGVLRKPKGVIVIADGNRIEDKSGVQQQGRAFMSRFEQHEVYSDANDNTEYASKHAWHPMVQTFFKDNPTLIDNYDAVFQTSAAAAAPTQTQSEEGRRGIWANMRSWERISRKEYAADEIDSPVTLAECVGNLGTGVGTAYDAHKRVLASLVSFDTIMADPHNAQVPTAMDEVYQVAMIVSLRCKSDQMPAVRAYGERLPLEMQAVMLRQLHVRKDITIGTTDAYVKWIANPQLSKLLNAR